jgi:hypothetical protein
MPLAAQTGFYGAVAQILPVLLLVMTIGETRLQKRTDGQEKADLKFAIFFTVVFFLFVAAGEIAALRVLMHGSDGEADEAFAVGGVVAGLTYVVIWAVRSSFDEYREDFSSGAQKRQLRLLAMVSVAVALGIYLALT